jgi:aldose 1-epimerase
MAVIDAIELAVGDYVLKLAPAAGGAVAAFAWRDKPLFRAATGLSVLDMSCFPLVPFSNRIAFGRFTSAGREVRLRPNFPGQDHPHPLHGFGWLSSWQVEEHSPRRVRLRHAYPAGEWPWCYCAEQVFDLAETGLTHSLSVANCDDLPMPAGLGFHPYFPRTAATRYIGMHRGAWQTGGDGLPQSLDEGPGARDWWEGRPAGDLAADTVFTGRHGPLDVIWPERDLRLIISPSDNLDHTAVLTPEGADYFCVEPVTHATNAINATDPDHGMRHLDPGESLTASVHYGAMELR